MLFQKGTALRHFFCFLTVMIFAPDLIAERVANSSPTDITTLNWPDLLNKTQADSKSTEKPSDLPSMPDLGTMTPASSRWLTASLPSHSTSPTQASHTPQPLFDGEHIKISGYIVPIEYSPPTTPSPFNNTPKESFTKPESVKFKPALSRFFLVPNFGAILFEQAPPQTQIIYVTLETPYSTLDFTQPYWVNGYLYEKIETYLGATARYTLHAKGLSAYNEPSLETP